MKSFLLLDETKTKTKRKASDTQTSRTDRPKSTMKNGKKFQQAGNRVKSKARTANEQPTKKVGQKVEPEVKKTKLKRRAPRVGMKGIRKATESHVLALTNGKRTSISKIGDEKLSSILGDSVENIQQLLEDNSGSVSSMLHKKMLQTLVDLIPFAENNIRDSKGARGVYQINSLIQSVRELLIDVQQANDRGNMGEVLAAQIIKPVFSELAFDIVTSFHVLENDAARYMTTEGLEKYKQDLIRERSNLAHSLNAKYEKASSDAREFLQR